MANNQEVFIDVKTNIIAPSSHNGIIVQCGIHQGPDMLFWPCTLDGAPTSLSAQQFASAPTSAAIQWPQTGMDSGGAARQNGDVDSYQDKRILPPPPSPVYSFRAEDDNPPDNFIESGKSVRLNVFQTEPVVVEGSSSGPELTQFLDAGEYNRPESKNVMPTISSNRATTARIATRSTRNSNYPTQQSATDSKTTISQESLRPREPVVLSRTGRTRDSSIQAYTSITPTGETYQTTATSYEQYDANNGDAKIPNYDYNRIEKQFTRSPPLGKIPAVMADPTVSYGTEQRVIQNTSQNRQPPPRYGSMEQLPAYHWNRQEQHRSTPDLRYIEQPPAYSTHPKSVPDGVEFIDGKDGQRRVPEQMFHLYQTRDAFGNLLAQCEMEIETDDQLLLRLSLNRQAEIRSTDDTEKNNSFVANFGLPLIPEYLSPELLDKADSSSNDSKAAELEYPERLQSDYHSPVQQQRFIDTSSFYDADSMRRACSSLYPRRLITPIPAPRRSLQKVPERASSPKTTHGFANKIRKPKVIRISETNTERLRAEEENEAETMVPGYSTAPANEIWRVSAAAAAPTVSNRQPIKEKYQAVGENRLEQLMSEKSGNSEETTDDIPRNSHDGLERGGDSVRLSDWAPPESAAARSSPAKSILLHRSSTRKSGSLRKKVRFPTEERKQQQQQQSKVIAVGHRLLVDANLDLV